MYINHLQAVSLSQNLLEGTDHLEEVGMYGNM
jgi:hypothetical protein